MSILIKTLSTQLLQIGTLQATAPLQIVDGASTITLSSTSSVAPTNVPLNVQQTTAYAGSTATGQATAYTAAYNSACLVSTFTITPYQNNTNSVLNIRLTMGAQQSHAVVNNQGGSCLSVYNSTNLTQPLGSALIQVATIPSATPATGPDKLGYLIQFSYTQTTGLVQTFNVVLYRVNTVSAATNAILGTASPWPSLVVYSETLL